MIRRFLVSLGFIIGIIISAILERNLTSKHYATMIIACVFALYLLGEIIYDYVLFRKTYKSRFEQYKAKLVNTLNLDVAAIEADRKTYYKKFKRTMLKDSVYRLIIICGILGVFLLIFIAMFI